MRKPHDVDEVATWVISVIALLAISTGLAESFRSLIDWAATHGYHGFWAYVWPMVVDSFSVVGEVAVFTSIRRHWPWKKRIVPWFSILVGLGISVSVNVGVTAGGSGDWLTPATHAVAPLAAAMMLTIALSVLKSIMTTKPEPVPVVVPAPVVVPEPEATAEPEPVPEPEPVAVPEPVAETPDPVDEESPDPTPERPVVRRRPAPTPSQIERAFAGHIKRNELPSMNAVMARLHLGKPRAKAVLAHLEAKMAEAAQVPDIPLPADWDRELADI